MMASSFQNIDRSEAINNILLDLYKSYHKDKVYRPVVNKYVVISTDEGDRVEEVKEIVVHTFRVSDADDPDLHAAEPLFEWERSEFGQWVMKNACDTPSWHRTVDYNTYGYVYQIRAKFMGPALTEMALRYAFK